MGGCEMPVQSLLFMVLLSIEIFCRSEESSRSAWVAAENFIRKRGAQLGRSAWVGFGLNPIKGRSTKIFKSKIPDLGF
jgi:hypothetical protein